VIKRRLFQLSLLAAASGACLPRGEPPAGQQILADRGAVLGPVVPPNGDGVLRFLILRYHPNSTMADLSVIALDTDNQPSPELPLLSNFDANGELGCRFNIYCSFDAEGRITVYTDQGPVAVDAAKGQVEAVDWQHPMGRYFIPDPGGATGTLYDADGHSMSIQLAPPTTPPSQPDSWQLLGDDFYYRDPKNALIDIPPSDVPMQVASDVLVFRLLPTTNFYTLTSGEGLLLLTRAAPDGNGKQYSVFDPASKKETLLPFDGSQATLSPDARWVLAPLDHDNGIFALFDLWTGVSQTIDLHESLVTFTWRPGTPELWVETSDPTGGNTLWVVQTDGSAVSFPGDDLSHFSDDGAYWFSGGTLMDNGTQVMNVGIADDPAAPQYQMNPPNTFLDYLWELPDGRLLMTDYVKEETRSDVTLLDPRTGETHLVGQRGYVAAVGQTRFLGLFNVLASRGDLAAVDYDTRTRTILAPEFTVTAFAEPQGADQLAPGTRIVYQYQARTASPYDGIWVTNCP
jgi:hypothetical protein